MAGRKPPEGCLRHSDYGSQHASLITGKTMGENGVRPSTGSVESPWDNAPTESPMGTIKSECAHARTYKDREQAAPGIFVCMGCFHSRYRIHSALGHVSPVELEEAHAGQSLAA